METATAGEGGFEHLREHSIGLNAGRWDYIFSVIKKFHDRPDFTLPDRAQVSMTVPFMRAYTELLVQACHRRGTFAMGGMAAFIPSRKDAEVNRVAMERVREDKEREARDGFDGTWVAHPDPVVRVVPGQRRVSFTWTWTRAVSPRITSAPMSKVWKTESSLVTGRARRIMRSCASRRLH